MKRYDENGFLISSSLVTISREEYERLKKAEKELLNLKKLNRPPNVEFRKRKLFGGRERR